MAFLTMEVSSCGYATQEMRFVARFPCKLAGLSPRCTLPLKDPETPRESSDLSPEPSPSGTRGRRRSASASVARERGRSSVLSLGCCAISSQATAARAAGSDRRPCSSSRVRLRHSPETLAHQRNPATALLFAAVEIIELALTRSLKVGHSQISLATSSKRVVAHDSVAAALEQSCRQAAVTLRPRFSSACRGGPTRLLHRSHLLAHPEEL
jgi:hypothetical protein